MGLRWQGRARGGGDVIDLGVEGSARNKVGWSISFLSERRAKC